MSQISSVSGCVFLPALASLQVGIHTVCVLFVWERSMLGQLSRELTVHIVFAFQCRRFIPRERSLRRSMAALVSTQRHLWFSLSQISEKDRVFLLDAPILPSGPFSAAVKSVVDRFQEAKKQVAAFQRLSLVVLSVGLIGGISSSRVWAPLTEKSRNGALPLVPLLKEKDRKGDSTPGRSPLGRWRIGGPSFSIKRLRSKGPDTIGPGHLRARPFG